MPKLGRLPIRLAERINQLFPPAQEHADVLEAVQRWGREDIELSVEQIRKTLGAIKQYAIPKSQALVWKQTSPALRSESEAMLNDWRALEALLAAALK